MDLREVGLGHVLDRSVLGLVQVAGCYECSNERACCVKCG
jgi:hypothetical protein